MRIIFVRAVFFLCVFILKNLIFFFKNHQKIKIILRVKFIKKGEKIHNSTKLSTFDKPYFMGIWAVFHIKNSIKFQENNKIKIRFLRVKKRQKSKKNSLFIIIQKNLSNKTGNKPKPLCHKGFGVFEYF